MTTSSRNHKTSITRTNLFAGYRDMGSDWMKTSRGVLVGASGGAFIGSLIASGTGSIVGFFLGVGLAIFALRVEKIKQR